MSSVPSNPSDVKSASRFDSWMCSVDRYIARACCGLDSRDLPDCCYADWYEDGVKPQAAARRAIRSAGGEF